MTLGRGLKQDLKLSQSDVLKLHTTNCTISFSGAVKWRNAEYLSHKVFVKSTRSLTVFGMEIEHRQLKLKS